MIFYTTSAIFTRFRNKQDENVNGISRSSRVLRKRRNLVSMQFNMMNWLLETISFIPLLFVENVFLKILYLLVISCGTPLVILFNLLFYILTFYQFYFFWSTFWALRKTGGWPGSTSSHAWGYSRKIRIRWLPSKIKGNLLRHRNRIVK